MPNEAQESQVLMAPAAPAGMLSESHLCGSESPSLGTAQGVNATGSFVVAQRNQLSSLSGGAGVRDAGAAVYASDEEPSPVVEENSGHCGTTLREHDYIGLSVSSSSSSFQNVHKSPVPRDCEKAGREEFNLNLGATELRLGPTSLRRSGSAAEISATKGSTEQQRAFISSMEPSKEQTAASERGAAASADYKFASRDQGFSTYTHVHATSEKEEPSSVDDCAKTGFGRSFANTDKWHEERARRSTDDSLNLGIALMPNRSKSNNADADKKLFQHSDGSVMEEKNQRQSDQQEILPQHSQEVVVPFADVRTCPEHCSSAIQEDPSPGSKKYTEKTPLARGHQHNSMVRPKRELSMQENRVPEMQGAQDAAPDSVSASMHAPMMQGMHPSQASQPDTSYPQEARYPQDSILVNPDPTGIVQEFMAHKLKVQMRQGGGDNGHYQPAGAEHHLPHSSPQVPESRAMNGTHSALTGSRSMFSLSKNGVGGAKRGFSETLGSTVPPESRSGPYTDGRNGFVEGGALREGSVGNMGRSNGTEMSLQSKHQLGAPPGTSMYSSCNNPRPSPPSWQQSLEPSGGLFGPFRSQWPTQGPQPQMSNRAEATTVSGSMESNSKPRDSSRSKNIQETVASSEISKHPSSDTRPASLEESAPTTAPPPRQSQMVGWPPVRNFRKTLVQQQPPRPVPQERQPRPTTTPQATSTVIPTTAAPANSGAQTTQTSLLVKVYMDGLSIGRKVDLTANNSYERLKSALEDMFQDMFQQFIRQPGDPQSSSAGKTGMSSSCSQKFNFLHSSEYVLTYEDRESDLMLVGDVPWEMFTTIVRRLRIMKGVDIAQRGGDNTMNPQVEAV